MKRNVWLFLLLAVFTVVTVACTIDDNNSASNDDNNASNENDENGEETSDRSWLDVEEAGTLVVGTSGTYAPVTFFNEDNELTGFDVELARAIAEYLEVDIEFSTMDFDGILPALRNGQINFALNDFAVTEERLETFDFTEAYKYSYGSIIVRTEDLDQFQSVDDLTGIPVALGSLTSNYARFAEHIEADGVAYDGGVEAILRDILNGNRDAYLNDRLVLARTLEEFNNDGLAVAENIKYHATESAIPVLKGNLALIDKLNEAIDALRQDGTIAELSEEFLGEDASDPVDGSEVYEFDF
ncbi:amino acid ABC transporter substrate-binding protein, PAAT family (TC 3.A.1.3.-) [Amphibacillus marinus]|uniref:Amino acid ABC transporter substrate-binding protein, PAAT family (TC 3.A.1.3.-) n=1 Tax=Amphibacillus marinus TaxID=872970 RepID=A0A1H8QDV9_9BACI|nr:transporter substrate-binding domain-containing protein [Amphibacillus marinus]SEO52420.1 amino acid ABC transporter substrate-binding protein, PAAT family (TC 3.A.1.3.-) [Amphibacillus marinus]